MEVIAGQYSSAGAPAATANTDLPAQVDSHGYLIVSGNASATPIPVTISEAVGAITWAAPVAVAMTGSSKTFVPADTARKALLMWSPSTNAAAGIDIAGGTVVLAAAIQLSPGLPPIVFLGADTPAGIVTAIGTNTQNLYYQSGS